MNKFERLFAYVPYFFRNFEHAHPIIQGLFYIAAIGGMCLILAFAQGKLF